MLPWDKNIQNQTAYAYLPDKADKPAQSVRTIIIPPGKNAIGYYPLVPGIIVHCPVKHPAAPDIVMLFPQTVQRQLDPALKFPGNPDLAVGKSGIKRKIAPGLQNRIHAQSRLSAQKHGINKTLALKVRKPLPPFFQRYILLLSPVPIMMAMPAAQIAPVGNINTGGKFIAA
jgi:hypothetical protein